MCVFFKRFFSTCIRNVIRMEPPFCVMEKESWCFCLGEFLDEDGVIESHMFKGLFG